MFNDKGERRTERLKDNSNFENIDNKSFITNNDGNEEYYKSKKVKSTKRSVSPLDLVDGKENKKKKTKISKANLQISTRVRDKSLSDISENEMIGQLKVNKVKNNNYEQNNNSNNKRSFVDSHKSSNNNQQNKYGGRDHFREDYEDRNYRKGRDRDRDEENYNNFYNEKDVLFNY